MSVKVRISYNEYDEVKKVLALLAPLAKTVKIPDQQSGPYKKAYVDIDDLKLLKP